MAALAVLLLVQQGVVVVSLNGQTFTYEGIIGSRYDNDWNLGRSASPHFGMTLGPKKAKEYKDWGGRGSFDVTRGDTYVLENIELEIESGDGKRMKGKFKAMAGRRGAPATIPVTGTFEVAGSFPGFEASRIPGLLILGTIFLAVLVGFALRAKQLMGWITGDRETL
jgi:hypothetical protein